MLIASAKDRGAEVKLTEGVDRVEWLRRVAGVEDGGEARRCARGQCGAGVLQASDLLESMRGDAVDVYKTSGWPEIQRR